MFACLACAHAPPPEAPSEHESDPELERNDALVAADPLCRYVAPTTEIRVLDVRGREPNLSVDGGGPAPQAGSHFVVLSRQGYVGEIAVAGDTSPRFSCHDGCPDFVRPVVWMDRGAAAAEGARFDAFGPFAEVHRSGRILGPDEEDHSSTEWSPVLTADLDGDGTADVRVRTHICGCWDEVRETSVRHGSTWTVSSRLFRGGLLDHLRREHPCPQP